MKILSKGEVAYGQDFPCRDFVAACHQVSMLAWVSGNASYRVWISYRYFRGNDKTVP